MGAPHWLSFTQALPTGSHRPVPALHSVPAPQASPPGLEHPATQLALQMEEVSNQNQGCIEES